MSGKPAASRYDFDFIRNPAPADPSPLTYPVTVALAGSSEAVLEAFARQHDLAKLLEAQQRAAVVLYERAGKYDYLKFGG